MDKQEFKNYYFLAYSEIEPCGVIKLCVHSYLIKKSELKMIQWIKQKHIITRTYINAMIIVEHMTSEDQYVILQK